MADGRIDAIVEDDLHIHHRLVDHRHIDEARAMRRHSAQGLRADRVFRWQQTFIRGFASKRIDTAALSTDVQPAP